VVSATPVDLADAAIAADVAAGLTAVEAGLAEAARAQETLLTHASRHLIDAGGKRFRATLVLLAARFGNPHDERIVPAATAIELTHLATLYHDDVMDEAAIRRGHESANSRWTNTVAILTGDFLFARASQILAGLGDETLGPQPGHEPLSHYLHVVEEKTASLIATAGRFGAMFSGAAPEIVERMATACHAIGVAFQLSDDILDVASPTGETGKAPGTDLREGVRSLPVLHALRSPGHGGGRLVELLTAADLTDESLHAEALALLRAHPAMEAARSDLRRWAGQARDAVTQLPDGPVRAAFETMCDFVVDRSG
jgi:heptaprenyl diphosphate synthase